MLVTELITSINDMSDEKEPSAIVVAFINDAISKINIECDTIFPLITVSTTDITFIPDKWVYTLIIPFGVGRVKQKDSSEFEFSAAYNEFMGNLLEFRSKYTIPVEYVDTSVASVVESDIMTVPGWDYGGW